MATKKKKVENIIKEQIGEKGTYIGKDGQKYQIPTPVVPVEDAVAKDAPIYENMPEEVK